MSILDKKLFEPLKSELSKSKSIGYIRNKFGNIGDGLIERGTFKFFNDHNLKYEIAEDPNAVSKYDLLVFYGGGHLGYSGSNQSRNRWLKNNIRKVILPSSHVDPELLRFNGDINLDLFDVVFIREVASLAYHNGILAPDMALYLDKQPETAPTEDVGLFLRKDAESIFGNHNHLDPVVAGHYGNYCGLAGRYRKIITDRLHFAIAGLLTGRDVTLLPNNYHKNKSMYDTWLADVGCKWANSV